MHQEINFDTIAVIEDEIALKEDALLQGFSEYINKLILTNFERLVQLLYRIDVSELKLKKMLAENPEQDAGKIIAAMIIQRQIQKIRFKKEMTNVNDENCQEEKW